MQDDSGGRRLSRLSRETVSTEVCPDVLVILSLRRENWGGSHSNVMGSDGDFMNPIDEVIWDISSV
jgi:hypothetical protein